jgi:hypothetical protein
MILLPTRAKLVNVTTKPDPKTPPTDDVIEGGDDQYVTKSELRGMFEEFFGKGEKSTTDDGGVLDLGDDGEALGVYSIRDLEKIFERQVSKMSKNLAASMKLSTVNDDKPDDKNERIREDKPTTLDATALVDRAKSFLWGARGGS